MADRFLNPLELPELSTDPTIPSAGYEKLYVRADGNLYLQNAAGATKSFISNQSVQTQNLVTVQGSTGAISFANSNGITFGGNASTITASHNGITAQTVQAQSISLSGNTVGTSTVTGNQIYFQGGNNITLSGTNNTIVISAASQSSDTNKAGTGFTTAGNNVGISGTYNSNGLNLSITTPAQSVQTQNVHNVSLSGNTSGALAQISSGTLILAGGNNITLSQNGQSITISGVNQTVDTNKAGTGFTSAGNNISLSGTLNTNGLSLSASVAAQSVQPVGSFGISTGGNSIGTSGTVTNQLIFVGGNNVTLSQATGAGGNTITISGVNTVAQSVQTQSTVAIQGSTGNISFSNSNNVSFGFNASTITASASFNQTVQTQNVHNVTLSGNTAGVLAAISSGTLTIAGGNNITISQNGNAITISGANAGGAQTGISGISAGTTQITSGTVSFANANGISFGANGNTLTASHNGITQQSTQPVAVSGSNGSFTYNTLSLGASNGLTFYTTNGSIVGSYTVPTQTVDTNKAGTGFTSAGNNISLSGTLNTNGLSLSASVAAQSVQPVGSFGISTGGNSVGTSGTVTNQLIFVGGNNVTLSQATGAGGNTITISGVNTVAQSVQTQNTVAIQGSTGNISFSNSNGITFGFNASTITASHNGITQQTTQAQSINLIGNTVGTSFVSSNQINFAGGNNITLSGTNGSITISAANQTVDTNKAGTGFTSAGNNISLSGTLNTNGLSLNASVAAQTVQTQNVHNVTLSGNTAGVLAAISSGTLTIAGGNNITLSQNGNAITISGANTVAQSVQPVAVSGSNGSFSFSTLSLGSSNGLNFYTTNGSVVGSYTVPTQSNQTLSQVITGNTTGNTSGVTYDARSITLQGFGAASVGISTSAGGTSLIVSTPVQTNYVLSNSNNVSFGTNGSTVTASASFNQTTQPAIQSIAFANTTFTTGAVSFSNANGFSFGSSAGAVTASYTVPSTAGLISAINISGGTTSNNLTNAVFSNSNNVSFGLNGSTLTASASFNQTVQTQSTVAVQGSTGAISFANSNGITFGGNANTITASYNQTVQPVGSFGISTGGNSVGTSGTVTNSLIFVGGNNVTLSQATGAGGNTITISGANQSVDTNKAGTGFTSAGNNISLSGTLNTNGLSLSASVAAQSVQTQGSVLIQGSSGSIVLSNSNNVSFGFNASTITASASFNQTNQTLSQVILGNTTGNTSGVTYDARSISWQGLGAISVGISTSAGGTSLLISGTQTAQTQNIIQQIIAGTQTKNSGSLSFANSNGISFGLSGSNTITASYTVPTQTTQAQSISLSGNTVGNSTITGNQIYFQGGNNITLSGTGSTIIISAGNAGAGGGIAIADSLFTVSSGTVQFVNSNGISFGLDMVSSKMTASHNGITSQSVQTQNVHNVTLSGNTAGALAAISSGTMTLAGGNNIVLSQNGNAITISASNQTVDTNKAGTGFTTAGNNIGLSGTLNTNGFSLSASVAAQSVQPVGSFGISTGGNSVGTSGTVTNQLIFVGGNNVTLSQATGVGGNTITISGVNTVAQSVQPAIQSFAVANSTFTTGQVGLSNANGISFGSSAGSITASYTVPSTAGLLSAINYSAGTTSNNSSAIVFSNANGVSFGLNAGTITASVAGFTAGISTQGNTSGTTGLATNQLVYVGGNNITLSQGTGAGGNTLTISAAQGGIAAGTQTATSGTLFFANSNGVSFGMSGSNQVTASFAQSIQTQVTLVSYWANLPTMVNTQTQQQGNSTYVVYPLLDVPPLSVGYLRMAHTINFASTSFASTVNTTFSYQQAETHNMVIYQQGSGANSMSLQSVASTSAGITWSINVAENSTTNMTITQGFSFPVSNGTSSYSTTYGVSGSTIQISTTHLSAFTGLKFFDTSFAASLSSGNYWVAYGVSKASTTQGTNMSGASFAHSHFGLSQVNNTIGNFGIPNNASIQLQMGLGSFTTVGGGTTASMNFSNITSSASHIQPYLTLQRIA